MNNLEGTPLHPQSVLDADRRDVRSAAALCRRILRVLRKTVGDANELVHGLTHLREAATALISELGLLFEELDAGLDLVDIALQLAVGVGERLEVLDDASQTLAEVPRTRRDVAFLEGRSQLASDLNEAGAVDDELAGEVQEIVETVDVDPHRVGGFGARAIDIHRPLGGRLHDR